MSEEKSILSIRINQMRKEINLTQEELAKKLGLNNKSSIANYESGYSIPSDEVKLKMCEVFHCSTDYLMGNSNIKIPNSESDFDNIEKFYNEKAENLLKNKYINELVNLNLKDTEIENILKIITSEEPEVKANYASLLNGLLSILSLTYNEITIKQIKKIIKEYCEDRIKLLNEEKNIYEKRMHESEEQMIEHHIDKIHPLLSGKKSASLDDNAEALLNYMNNKNIDVLFTIPVLGKIAAGQPILAEEYLEGYLPVDPNIYGMTVPDDYFYLKVSGESMNLKVHNGDYALIHKQDYAENGDIIVAIVNGFDEATMKRYKKINDELIMLEPMSSYPMEPLVIDLKNTNFQIIGKAIGQFGKF